MQQPPFLNEVVAEGVFREVVKPGTMEMEMETEMEMEIHLSLSLTVP